MPGSSMHRRRNASAISVTPAGCLRFAAAVFVLYVGSLILTPFPDYLPADFDRGFLANKREFFYSSGYFLGFYAHIASSPIALFCGTLQMSRDVRDRWPRFHRSLGKVYVVLVLSCVAPGGAVMSLRAFGGWSTMLCFGSMSAFAWGFTFLAWREAKAGRYASHGRWMMRSYLMLCSAITLRLIHYLIQPLDFDATFAYQLSAWLSWIVPLGVFEIAIRR